ncbi:uncharacterized protein PITG_08241 [Phytophthora infestans T30-4]|uniref:Uncharacterized protein n=1 Tax=Phytophthora infestans (strain T30-4) TaxID=403677 RepID=D0N9T4_PHYIT|nr:uncharacterized protein PITG_08241 [Phytophthora infestans T30-4]EEY54572.1 hypothetical protein PITG_08241 [Phytophthora infestans T30-4]|eukprot:XP_002904394.1 hypothetical protein PITG_08241 [Phytophthora infestans T30-4]
MASHVGLGVTQPCCVVRTTSHQAAEEGHTNQRDVYDQRTSTDTKPAPVSDTASMAVGRAPSVHTSWASTPAPSRPPVSPPGSPALHSITRHQHASLLSLPFTLARPPPYTSPLRALTCHQHAALPLLSFTPAHPPPVPPSPPYLPPSALAHPSTG